MCGLITVFHPERNIDNQVLIDHFLAQRSRGVRGFGYTYLSRSGFLKTERFEHEAECFYKLPSVRSKLIQFHHRTPTSTENCAFQNHPITKRTMSGFYSITHNGMIDNYKDLRNNDDKHKEVVYTTQGKEPLNERPPLVNFNDSETLLHEIVFNIEEPEHEIKAEGTIAFVLLEADVRRRLKYLSYGRNIGNPLYHAIEKDGTHVISSENSEMSFSEIIEINKMFTWEFMDDGTMRRFEPKSLVFPIAPIVTVSARSSYTEYDDGVGNRGRFSGFQGLGSRRRHNAYTPLAKTTDQKEIDNKIDTLKEKRKGQISFKMEDGTIVRPKHKEGKRKKPLNSHDEYLEILGMGNDNLQVFELIKLSSISDGEIRDIMKDIDETIQDMQKVKVYRNKDLPSRKIQNVIDACGVQRLRYLRVLPEGVGFKRKVTNTLFSLFRGHRIGSIHPVKGAIDGKRLSKENDDKKIVEVLDGIKGAYDDVGEFEEPPSWIELRGEEYN